MSQPGVATRGSAATHRERNTRILAWVAKQGEPFEATDIAGRFCLSRTTASQILSDHPAVHGLRARVGFRGA